MTAEISLHYDGPIAADHKLSLRVLGGALDSLQGAIDRAVIDVKYGSVWKHARLRYADYPLADFDVTGFREGGFIADLKQSLHGLGPQVLDRIRGALVPGHAAAIAEAGEVYDNLANQATLRRQTLEAGAINAPEFSQFMEGQATEINGQFGDRSILKEIDQLLTPIRATAHAGSTLEITISTDTANTTLFFDRATAKKFHRVVSTRRIGNPLTIEAQVRSLSQGNNFQSSKGKLENLNTGREFILHIPSERAFNALLPYLQKGEHQQNVRIIACPVLEYESFDPYGGDMYFLKLA